MPPKAVPTMTKPPAAVAAAVIWPLPAGIDRQPSAMSGQPTPSAAAAPTLHQVPTGWTLGLGIGQLLQLAAATGQLQLPARQQLAKQQQDSQRAQQELEQALEHQQPAALVAKTPVHASSAAAETAAAMEIDPGSAGSSGVKENNPSPTTNWWVKSRMEELDANFKCAEAHTLIRFAQLDLPFAGSVKWSGLPASSRVACPLPPPCRAPQQRPGGRSQE